MLATLLCGKVDLLTQNNSWLPFAVRHQPKQLRQQIRCHTWRARLGYEPIKGKEEEIKRLIKMSKWESESLRTSWYLSFYRNYRIQPDLRTSLHFMRHRSFLTKKPPCPQQVIAHSIHENSSLCWWLHLAGMISVSFASDYQNSGEMCNGEEQFGSSIVGWRIYRYFRGPLIKSSLHEISTGILLHTLMTSCNR